MYLYIYVYITIADLLYLYSTLLLGGKHQLVSFVLGHITTETSGLGTILSL